MILVWYCNDIAFVQWKKKNLGEENWIIGKRKLKISSFKGQQNQYLLLIVQIIVHNII